MGIFGGALAPLLSCEVCAVFSMGLSQLPVFLEGILLHSPDFCWQLLSVLL